MYFKSPLGKLFQLDSVLPFGFVFHGLTRFYDDSELDFLVKRTELLIKPYLLLLPLLHCLPCILTGGYTHAHMYLCVYMYTQDIYTYI